VIDHEFRTILRNLITFMMEDPRTISSALDTLWVAKAIERIGDHAKNIAEYVIYVVEGTRYPPQQTRAERGKAERHGGNTSVLIVEDEPAIVELVSYSLREAGWEIRTAGNVARPGTIVQASPTCCCSTGCCPTRAACACCRACAATAISRTSR
jgi:hypothetical protein